MPQTFEELIGRDLDGLYSGALFMTGGNEAATEDLLLGTIREAFHAYRSSGVSFSSAEHWLEGRLAARALVELRSASFHGTTRGQPLYTGAAEVPIEARVALWLVVMRRWDYAAAAERLGVDRDDLKELLKHREKLVAAVGPIGYTAGNG